MPVWAFDAIGTRWEITSEAVLSADDTAAVSALIDEFDRTWSRFRSDSFVREISGGGRIPTPPDSAALFAVYQELSRATHNAISPLIGASLEALGYDADYSLQPRKPRTAPADWESILRWNDEYLTLTHPATIDIGAIGKGRLVDLVLAALVHLDGAVTVNAGGDIASRGAALRVALEHPYDTRRAIGVVTLRDGALCGSATNRRVWGAGLHHVIDGRTGFPTQEWAATWAIGNDAMTADAISTALFFDGGAGLAADWGVEWIRMSTDGRVSTSPGCRAELFTTATSQPAGSRRLRPE